MEKGLTGKRIVIGGSRKLEEISTLIEKQGGVPLIRSLQGTVFLAEKEVEPDLLEFVEEGADWVIFTTGIGLETLVDLSEKLGLKEQFVKNIRQAKVASRGYKTLAALKKLDILPAAVDEDGTTSGLVHVFDRFELSNKTVWIQLHGETAPVLTEYLKDRGAEVRKLLPYQHISPDAETVKQLCYELQNKQVDAVCFTTATQVRSLFDYARDNGLLNEVVRSFNHDVLAVAVGKVTFDALKEERIERALVPEHERMGAMIVTLAKYYQGQ
jgi:uroporphyrinogen-III synthase